MTSTREIVLASTSIRRKEILSLLGFPFRTVSPEFEEKLTPQRPASKEVASFAEGKARSMEKQFPRAILIGSDTLIEHRGEKIGKPRGPADAKKILQRLQGEAHRIWTAVALLDDASREVRIVTSEIGIWMGKMTPEEIEAYVATGEPLDKAGAYSLQGEGRRYIERLEGDYLAAVGLPLRPIAVFLKERGVPILLDIEGLYREKGFRNWKSYYPGTG